MEVLSTYLAPIYLSVYYQLSAYHTSIYLSVCLSSIYLPIVYPNASIYILYSSTSPALFTRFTGGFLHLPDAKPQPIGPESAARLRVGPERLFPTSLWTWDSDQCLTNGRICNSNTR